MACQIKDCILCFHSVRRVKNNIIKNSLNTSVGYLATDDTTEKPELVINSVLGLYEEDTSYTTFEHIFQQY